jgi:hypothetical protein
MALFAGTTIGKNTQLLRRHWPGFRYEVTLLASDNDQVSPEQGSAQMDDLISKTTAVFSRPFTISGFDEMLPTREYEIETELCGPVNHLDPASWKTCVQMHLQPRISHPGLTRSLTVSLTGIENLHRRPISNALLP